MTDTLSITDLSPEQRELWQRVNELWALSQRRDEPTIEAALHPRYVGWDMSIPVPHDRQAAVASVSGPSPQLTAYALQPRSVQVYDHQVGVVHYGYTATVVPRGGKPMDVSGKWTEVYLKQGGAWIMIAVSGRPDAQPASLVADEGATSSRSPLP